MVGSSRGLWNKNDCIASGIAGTTDALNRLGISKTNYFFPKPGGWKNPIQPLYEVKYKKSRSKSFVDYQHDVTTDDVRLAHREGFISVEHLKRYTTLGMANDQGKMGNIIGLSLMAELLNKNEYFTLSAGKFHMGNYAKRGFDEVHEDYEINGKGGEDYWLSALEKRPKNKRSFKLFFNFISGSRT